MQTVKLSDLDLDTMFGGKGQRRSLIVVGAGGSFPAAPIASVVKQGILDALARRSERTEPKLVLPSNSSHLTLELICTLLEYRFRDRFNLRKFITKVVHNDHIPETVFLLATLAKSERSKYIFTSNFDGFMYRAHEILRVPYRVITRAQFLRKAPDEPQNGDILAFHGTTYNSGTRSLSPPTSVDARGLATPFTSQMQSYIELALNDVDRVIFVGYSGSDHYDMNPVLQSYFSVPDRPQKLYWLSHNGSKKDFSEYVQNSTSFGLASSRSVFVDCEAAGTRQLQQMLESSGEYIEDDAPLQSDLDAASAGNVAGSLIDCISPWDSNSIADAQKVTEDLVDTQIWRPWVLMEHYFLDSLSNSEMSQKLFMGETENSVFLEVDLRRIASSILEFWKINRNGSAVIEEGHLQTDMSGSQNFEALCEVSKFRNVNLSLRFSLDQIQSAIKVQLGKARMLDFAFLYVSQAMVENYIGLTNLRICEFVRESMPHHFDLLEEAASTSRNWFSNSITSSEKANEYEVNSIGSSVTERSITSCDVWKRVAKFNLGRVKPNLEGIDLMIESITELEERARLGEDFERGACLLHATQQASIVVKELCGVEGNRDCPPLNEVFLASTKLLAEGVSEQEISERRSEALKVCNTSADNFYKITGRFDDRLIAACDALVVDKLRQGDVKAAEAELKKCKSLPLEHGHRQSIGWLKNIDARIAVLRDA